jgi:hypothetical protein
MRLIVPILFWVGLFAVVREWLYAKRHGLLISRAEKIYLAMALPIIFAAQLTLDLAGIGREVASTASALAMGVVLNAWAVRRRMGRAN